MGHRFPEREKILSQILAFCRHGDHVDNKTTPTGWAQIERSARWLGSQLMMVSDAAVVSSDEPRAMEAAARYVQILRRTRLTVQALGADNRLGCDSGGLARLRKTIPKIPAYGSGFMEAWRALDTKALKEMGAPSATEVGEQASLAIRELLERTTGALIIVGHGTTHEPAFEAIYGVPMNDMPPAGVRLMRKYTQEPIDFDPATLGPYAFDHLTMPLPYLIDKSEIRRTEP